MSRDEFKEPQINNLSLEETQPDLLSEPALGEAGSQAIVIAEPAESLVGKVIAGHYEILSSLGEGGMSSVYKARHILLDSIRAIKLLHIPRASDGKILQRFQMEAKASFFLSHPNIVRVYDFGIEPTMQQPYLVMDCLEGKPLSTSLENERLSGERTIKIIGQVCDALAHAHSKGIVHRDIKPANIILSIDASGAEIAQLVDFGIAKLMNPEEGNDLTQTGEVFGTPLYMSPEQCLGRTVDDRSDIYSLGCVIYECLAGNPPFRGASQLETLIMHVQTEPEITDEFIPAKLQPILHRCLAKGAHERYQSIEALQDDLQALDETKKTRTNFRIGKLIKTIDKRFQNTRTSRILMALIVVCLFCTALVMTYRNSQPAKVIIVEKKASSPAVATVGAEKKTLLPKELAYRLESVHSPQVKIDIMLEWKKTHPEYNYYVENELRHWYLGINERKSAEHMDTIFRNARMDGYTVNILSGWNLGKDAKKALRSLLYWPETYPDLPSLSAASYIAAGDQYAQLGNQAKARWCYNKVILSKDKTIEGYKSFARNSMTR